MIDNKDKLKKWKGKFNYKKKDFNSYKDKVKDGNLFKNIIKNWNQGKISTLITKEWEPKEQRILHRIYFFYNFSLAYNPINLSYDNNP